MNHAVNHHIDVVTAKEITKALKGSGIKVQASIRGDELRITGNYVYGREPSVAGQPHTIDHLMRRHYVKPGMTGLAQISGARGETRTITDMRRRRKSKGTSSILR